MAITYDAPGDKIIVAGGTTATFDDIYLANVAGGWEVVYKLCQNLFCFDTKLVMGDATTPGYVADINVAVKFDAGVISGNGQKLIRVRKGTLTLGGVINVSDRTTYRGCYLYSANANNTYYFIDVDNVSDAALYLYNSFLLGGENIAGEKNIRFRQGGGRVWNCLFQQCFPSVGDSTNLDIYNLYVSHSKYGIRNLQAAYTNDVILHEVTYGLSLGGKSHGQTIKNGSIKQVGTKAIQCGAAFDQDYYVENFSIPTWDFEWTVGSNGKVYRQYSYNLTVLDRSGSPITTARVIGNYKEGAAFAEGVDGSGQLAADKVIIKGYYDLANGDTLVRITGTGYDYTYTEMIVYAPGYETKILRFDPEGAFTKEGNIVTLEKAQYVRLLDGDPILCLSPESPYHSKIFHTRIP